MGEDGKIDVMAINKAGIDPASGETLFAHDRDGPTSWDSRLR
jgi:hypothetical protein